MGRGFLSGIFMGAIVSAVLLFVSSQTLERQALSFPKPSVSAVEVPAGTEFDQARPETDPVVPNSETRPEADVVVEAPVPDEALDVPPTFDTSALEVPTPEVDQPDTLETVVVDEGDAPSAPGAESEAQVGDVSDLSTPEAPANAPETETQTPVVGAAPVQEAAPDASGESAAPVVETEVAALPQADAGSNATSGSDAAPAVTSAATAPNALTAPEIGTESSLPVPAITALGNDGEPSAIEVITPAPDPSQALQDQDADDLPSFLRPVEVLENAGEVETGRLPQVIANAVEGALEDVAPDAASEADPQPEVQEPEAEESAQPVLPTIRRPGAETAEVEEPASDEAAAEDAVDEDKVVEELPALTRYAASFENPNGNPLLSIVLVNTGPALSGEQLEMLPEFLAFGVQAGAAGAAETAQAYRDAGREVVLIPSLPQGATPQDVEQALRVNFETVAQSVAVMDVSGGSFQSDREAVSQMVDVIAATGHGLITFPRGLNTAHQRATRAGVSTGLIFRELDGDGEDSAQIQRTLDRAAFRARQDEAVILVGSTEQGTLAALIEWAVGNRAESVTLAPISAALAGGG